jgi:DNA-binding HxlR family transcriptional regulator
MMAQAPAQEAPARTEAAGADITAPDPAGEQALPSLDPVIHAQPRLRVTVALSALGAGDQMTFPRLQQMVGMTAGNLSTHLRKLEDAGYLAVTKSYRRRTPITYLALTNAGRQALEDYTATLQTLLGAAGSRPGREDPP